MYPVALEGALKLKEISYIHAEAYPAGELKHGPLALVDEKMPVIVLAPNDGLLEKLKSNISEGTSARRTFFIFTDADDIHDVCPAGEVVKVPKNAGSFNTNRIYHSTSIASLSRSCFKRN